MNFLLITFRFENIYILKKDNKMYKNLLIYSKYIIISKSNCITFYYI